MMYKDMLKLAKAYDDTLLADDSRFRGTAEVGHEDGSHFKWRNAFMMETERDKWILVFSEHFGYHIFDARDLVSFRHYIEQDFSVQELEIEKFRVPRE